VSLLQDSAGLEEGPVCLWGLARLLGESGTSAGHKNAVKKEKGEGTQKSTSRPISDPECPD